MQTTEPCVARNPVVTPTGTGVGVFVIDAGAAGNVDQRRILC